MKNKLSFVIGFVTSAILFTSIVFANNIDLFTAQKASFDVFVNGEKFESQNPTVVIEGRTYLPLKETGDALGANVQWNAQERKVEINKDGDNVENVLPTPAVEENTPLPIQTPIPPVKTTATTVDYKTVEPYVKNINGKDISVIEYEGDLYIEFAELVRQYPQLPANELMQNRGYFIVRPTLENTKSYIRYEIIKDYIE